MVDRPAVDEKMDDTTGEMAKRVLSLPANGKILISHLVDEGLLTAGNTVVCNNWPFTAVVTATGAFEASWEPVPADFVGTYGREFMRAEFETPSAWATAVCRVMRAQARAHKHRRDGDEEVGRRASRSKQKAPTSTEGRVAVNGWTACRVRLARDDPNRALGERLAGGTGDTIEVTLDALRRELCARISRTRAAPSRAASDSESEPDSTLVDGLAQRVEHGLALGCVKQRRAAAAAADAISATAHASSMAMFVQLAAHGDERLTPHSRKRKSIPDMSRHAKLSRVPDAEQTLQTKATLAFFRERAQALARPHAEAKALRAQRRQLLRRRIGSALDVWLRQRRALRRPADAPPAPVSSPGGSPGATDELVGMAAAVSATFADIAARLPCLTDDAALQGIALCTQCGSSGSALLECQACGDRYHGFCVSPLVRDAARFLCPACRVCAGCLDDRPPELLQCDQCGACMHAHCSAQRAVHRDGLAGLARENGRWVCDQCVACRECGFSMADGTPADGKAAAEWTARVAWGCDFSLCGLCTQQIEKGKVCPQCVATYASTTAGANMVCCDVCAVWIHTACDPRLTPHVYDALLTLEDAPYVCPACCLVAAGGEPEADPVSLPACLRQVPKCASPMLTASDSPSAPHVASFAAPVKQEPETEAANMLLSLTQSDVRFDRFAIDALETQFSAWAGDRRVCMLCSLHGDSAQLGRLVPVLHAAPGHAASQWVHVECLAWAWGPRSTTISALGSSHSGASSPVTGPGAAGAALVRFEGRLDASRADLLCSLCSRAGASFHCCAPVACSGSAYHLPCLLLAGSPAGTAPGQPQYCAGWRRALCAEHVPLFSAMMPADTTTASYADVRVEASVDEPGTPPAGPVRLGSLEITAWGAVPADAPEPHAVTAEFPRWVIPPDGFVCARAFCINGHALRMHIATRIEGPVALWCGHISQDAAVAEIQAEALGDLVGRLLAQLLGALGVADDHLYSAFARAAAHKPFRFLGLTRCSLYDLFVRRVDNYDRLCERARMARSRSVSMIPVVPPTLADTDAPPISTSTQMVTD